MVVPKAISSSSWFGDIMEIHGESLCLCFADVAGITLRITHPQFRLHSQSLHFFSVFPLLRKQFIFSFLSNLFVLLSMLRWDLRVSVSPLHITGRISALRTLKAHRCAEIWPNLGVSFLGWVTLVEWNRFEKQTQRFCVLVTSKLQVLWMQPLAWKKW